MDRGAAGRRLFGRRGVDSADDLAGAILARGHRAIRFSSTSAGSRSGAQPDFPFVKARELASRWRKNRPPRRSRSPRRSP